MTTVLLYMYYQLILKLKVFKKQPMLSKTSVPHNIYEIQVLLYYIMLAFTNFRIRSAIQPEICKYYSQFHWVAKPYMRKVNKCVDCRQTFPSLHDWYCKAF